MSNKFNIIYAIRFFCGKLESGTIEYAAFSDASKEFVERNAMSILENYRKGNDLLNNQYNFNSWMYNVQKIDLTVTQL